MNAVRPLIAALLVGLATFVALPAIGSAASRDRDRDHMSDRWEKKHRLNTHRNDARGDADRDGLRNLTEFRAHTDPRDADSDGDGRRDGSEDGDRDGLSNRDEQKSGHDAGDRDSDDDNTEDGDELVGSVVSFSGTTLVIKLNDGSQLSGTVTPDTEIECERGETAPAASASSEDDSDGDRDGDRDEDGEHDQDDGEDCGTDVLTAGTVVHEAELKAGTAGATWTEVEVLR